MNKQQGSGIAERVAYGIATLIVVRFGSKLGLTTEDIAWLAGGMVTVIGGAYGWWHNRPVAVLNRAAETLPESAALVISTPAAAPIAEKSAARDLANAASDKVIAQTA